MFSRAQGQLLTLAFAVLSLLHFRGESEFGVEALSPSEICESCQRVLFNSFQYYRYTTTKRLLRHRIKHLCNRYFEYRRHCLVLLVHRVNDIWEDMEKALDVEPTTAEPEYKPYKTCEKLKECDKDHSPIVITERRQINGMTTATAKEFDADEDAAAVTPDYIL